MANFFSNLYQRITAPTDENIDKLIYGSMPKENLNVPIKERLAGMGNNLSNYLLGTPAVTGQDDNGKPIYSSEERTGGALRDLAEGFKENATQGFSPDNWGQGKKNIATRVGEGLGSMAKFLESPAGRALLVGGAVGLTGGNGLQALTYGAVTGAKNQSNRMADKLYRDDLIQTQQNTLKNNPAFGALSDAEKAQILSNLESANPKYSTLGADEQAKLLQNAQEEYLTNRQNDQLQNIADDINNRRGYITQDVYKNLVDTQQLRDNADWRRMYFDTQQKNLEAQRDWQRQQYQMQQDEKRADRAFQYYNANLNHQDRLAALEAKGNAKPLSDKQVDDISSIDQSLSDMTDIINTYTAPKYKSYFGITGFAKRNPVTGKFDPIVSQMSQDIELFRKTVAKAKEGGRLTDQDQKYYEKALLNPNLTQDNFLRLANRFNNQMLKTRQILLDNYERQGKDTTNFIKYQTNKSGGNVDRLGIL